MKLLDNKLEDEQTHLKQQSTPLQQNTQNPSPSPPSSPPPTTTTSPPSPTHEFSFSISLHPLPSPTTTYNTNINHKTNTTTTTTTSTLQPSPPPLPPSSPSPPPAAIDLSPAGDIFFHGHLLPLHPLPHPSNDSPRSSTNSMDSFTLPINLLYHHSNPIGTTSFHCHHHTTFSDSDEPDEPDYPQVTINPPNPPKPKPFSIFNIPKWKKRSDNDTLTYEDQTKQRTTKKLKLDLSQLIKRYMKMVKPLLSFPKSKRSNTRSYKSYNNHQSYSYSTNSLSRKQPMDMMNRGGRRRGMLSAPASMRASPANSGVLLASGFVSPAKSTSESSMEELHAAIQAAIAHCKNSIAIDQDKVISQSS